MRSRSVITDFSSGEWSPRGLNRISNERYASACKEITNFTVLPLGGVSMRPGTQFVEDITSLSGTAFQMIPFMVADATYFLVLTGTKMRIYKDGARLGVVEITTPWADGELKELDWAQFEKTMYFVHGDYQQRKLTYVDDATWTFTTVTFTDIPQWAFNDASSPVEASANDIDFTFSGTWANGDTYDIELGGIQRTVTYSSDDATHKSRIDSALTLLLREPEAGIYGTVTVTGSYPTFSAAFTDEMAYYTGTPPPSIVAIVSTSGSAAVAAGASASNKLAEDAWSATRGWPRTVAVYQQRVFYGATDILPQSVWGSVVGAPDLFSTGPEDNDALSFRIWWKEAFIIQWMDAKQNLMIGTSRGDWIGQGTDGITPATVAFNRQTDYRAAKRRPIQVGSELFYIDLSQQDIRGFVYEWGTQAWQSPEVTYVSEHLGSGLFTDLGYHQLYTPIVFALREDGILCGWTYLRNQGVSAWHKHVTKGEFKAMAAGPEGVTESVYMVVERDGSQFVEYIPNWTPNYLSMGPDAAGDMQESQVTDLEPYLDSCIIDSTNPATGTIQGLTHLEGETVEVVLDNEPLGEFTVSSGTVTLGTTGTRGIAGIPYAARVITHPWNGGAQRSTRWVDVNLRVHGSAMPLVNGNRPPVHDPGTPLGTAQPLVKGDFPVNTFGNAASITIEQDEPLPVIVEGLYGLLAESGG